MSKRRRGRRKSISRVPKLEFPDNEIKTPMPTKSTSSRGHHRNMESQTSSASSTTNQTSDEQEIHDATPPFVHSKRLSVSPSSPVLNTAFRYSPSPDTSPDGGQRIVRVPSAHPFKLDISVTADDLPRVPSAPNLDEGFLHSSIHDLTAPETSGPESPFHTIDSYPQNQICADLVRGPDSGHRNIAQEPHVPANVGSGRESVDMILETSQQQEPSVVLQASVDMSIASPTNISILVPAGQVSTAEPVLVTLTPLGRPNLRHLIEDRVEKVMKHARPHIGIFIISNNALIGGLKRRIKTLPSDSQQASLLLRLSRAAYDLRKSLLKKGKLLGNGVFGQVFLTRTTLSSTQYALKQVRVDVPQQTSEEEFTKYIARQVNLLREKDTMLLTNHPFICQLKATWCERHPDRKISYFFLMEYAPFGSLAYYIIRKLHKTMTLRVHNFTYPVLQEKIMQHQMDVQRQNQPQGKEFRKCIFYIYSAEIASAIAYLHDVGLVHRDLKPANILIGRDYHLRITDFGFTNPREAYHSYRFNKPWDPLIMRQNILDRLSEDDYKSGTVAYDLPPEMARRELTDSTRYYPMDVWAVGVIMFEIYTGLNPFVATIDPQSKEKCAQAVLQWKDNILLNDPIFSAIIPDSCFRSLIRRTICDRQNRMAAEEIFAALDQNVERLTGQTLSQIGANPLVDLTSVFGSETKEPSSHFNQPWSPSTPSDVARHHPVAQIFPHFGTSPLLKLEGD